MGGGGKTPNPNVEEMLWKLNLTEEEEAVVEFSEDGDDKVLAPVEWVLVGKVLSPSPVHVNTVRSAMKPAWGNPIGLKIRSIGEKCDNLFVVEFGSARDMERVLLGSPWMVGRYAILLKEYDATLSASAIVFDRMELWVRILDLPLGWMNRQKGSRAISLIGQVLKMDVDADGKASGAFLRARVAIELDKPIRRGVRLRMNKNDEPRWFQAQYERLPYVCFACGKLGHSEIECQTPIERDEHGKLPYDVQLRAPEDRRWCVQSFTGAAAESLNSGSSSASKPPRHGDRSRGKDSGTSSRFSESRVDESEEPEVQSPLKTGQRDDPSRADGGALGASRRLDLDEDGSGKSQQARKRKNKVTPPVTVTPDLNLPGDSNAIMPVGLVHG